MTILVAEQAERLADRRDDPLKQWKVSPIDAKALENWSGYSAARDEMLARTHSEHAPWTIVRADRKRAARLNVIQDLLLRFDYEGKRDSLLTPSPDFIFEFDEDNIQRGLAP